MRICIDCGEEHDGLEDLCECCMDEQGRLVPKEHTKQEISAMSGEELVDAYKESLIVSESYEVPRELRKAGRIARLNLEHEIRDRLQRLEGAFERLIVGT